MYAFYLPHLTILFHQNKKTFTLQVNLILLFFFLQFTERTLAHHLLDDLGGPSAEYYIAMARLDLQKQALEDAEVNLKEALQFDHQVFNCSCFHFIMTLNSVLLIYLSIYFLCSSLTFCRNLDLTGEIPIVVIKIDIIMNSLHNLWHCTCSIQTPGLLWGM